MVKKRVSYSSLISKLENARKYASKIDEEITEKLYSLISIAKERKELYGE